MANRGALKAVRHARGQHSRGDETVDAATSERHRSIVNTVGSSCAAENSYHCRSEAVPHQRGHDFVARRALRDADVVSQAESAAAALVEASQVDIVVIIRGLSRDKLQALNNLCTELCAVFSVLYHLRTRRPVSGINQRSVLGEDFCLFLRRELGSIQCHLAKTFLQNGKALRQRLFTLQGDASEDSDSLRRGAVERKAGCDRSAHHSRSQRRDRSAFQLENSF